MSFASNPFVMIVYVQIKTEIMANGYSQILVNKILNKG